MSTGTGEYRAYAWQIVVDDFGYPSIHETDEDGRPGDLVAHCYADRENLIAAAPDLLEALETVTDLFARDGENSVARFDRLATWFHQDTGYMAPGKDQPRSGVVASADREELNRIYDEWFAAKVKAARAAIARARGAE